MKKIKLLIFSVLIFFFSSNYIFANNYAQPSKPLDAVEVIFGNTLPNPINHIIDVPAASSVYIQPSLKVDSYDVGIDATLVMYIYIRDINYGFMLPTKNVTLSSIQKFTNISKALDFSDAVGMTFDIYYGYQYYGSQFPCTWSPCGLTKILKYNVYRVNVVPNNNASDNTTDNDTYTDNSTYIDNGDYIILQGKVTIGEPVQNATLTIYDTQGKVLHKNIANTDSDGNFSFKLEDDENKIIKIEASFKYNGYNVKLSKIVSTDTYQNIIINPFSTLVSSLLETNLKTPNLDGFAKSRK